MSFWEADSFLSVFSGGMTCLGSADRMRSIRALSSIFPGVIAPALIASSRWSSRKLALRAALSGPWQAKQFSARMGRTSRLYSILVWAWIGDARMASALLTKNTRREKVIITCRLLIRETIGKAVVGGTFGLMGIL
jgi:hypothetical protein